MVAADGSDARIGESDGIDHPAVELGDARSRSASPRLGAHRFRDEPAERREVDHVGELTTVRGGAGGEHDRILERETSRLHRERGAAVAHCRLTLPGAPPVATRRS